MKQGQLTGMRKALARKAARQECERAYLDKVRSQVKAVQRELQLLLALGGK